MKMDFSTIVLSNNDHLSAVSFYRYNIVLRGQGTICSRKHRLQLSRHEIFTLGPYADASYESDGSEEVMLGCIGIHDNTYTPHDMTIIPAQGTELVRQIFYMGLDTQDNPLPFYDSVNAAIHQLMFSALIACEMQSTAIHPKVFQVIQKFNEHFTEAEYDIRPAIEETGYSMNYFRKVFQKETGVTPAGYLTKRRMDRAAELLDQFKDRVPVKEIAFQCGYEDPYYFSRQFKKSFGVSPKQYICGESS